MKVAFISYEYGHTRTYGEREPLMYGCGRFAVNLVKNLRTLGVDLDVFTANNHVKNFGEPWFIMKNGIKNFDDYDLLHSNESAGALIRHPNKVETLNLDYSKLSYASLGLKYRFFPLFIRMSLTNDRHIIVPSNLSRESIMKFDKNISNDKVSVIPHGVDKEVFNDSDAYKELAASFRLQYKLTDCFVVISVGRLVKHKRHEDIIRALAGLKKVALILVGSGRERNSLVSLARDNSVRLLHAGYIRDPDLVTLYNASNAYVHTSMAEGFGLTVLEAMACGLPIIAYNTSDFNYIVKHCGYLLRKGDFLGIRHAVQFLQENEKEAKILGRRAEKKSRLFSWDESARAYLKIYEALYAA